MGFAQATALRVNFVGELGWELHHPIEMQTTIFDLLMQSGKKFDLRPFGIKAMDSLRLEKSYRVIGRELSIEYSAHESGLNRFVRMDKPDFIGRSALLARQAAAAANRFVTLQVHGVTDADAAARSRSCSTTHWSVARPQAATAGASKNPLPWPWCGRTSATSGPNWM